MYEWVFDGIGSQIIGIVLSLGIGGFVGYKIGISQSINQRQIAKNNSNQKQDNKAIIKGSMNKNSKNTESVKQFQKAGDNSSQIQIGESKFEQK